MANFFKNYIAIQSKIILSAEDESKILISVPSNPRDKNFNNNKSKFTSEEAIEMGKKRSVRQQGNKRWQLC